MTPTDSSPRGHEHNVDRQLIRDIAAGSPDALGRLYDRHAAMMYGLALRIVQPAADAEEVVQDVFAHVWRDASRYEASRASVVGWLVMLTRSRAIDRLRARRARPDVSAVASGLAPPLPSLEPDPEARVVSAADALAVRRALLGLPEPQRQLVELAYFEGLTHSELAIRTGTPLGTVKTRLRTALFTLRGALTT